MSLLNQFLNFPSLDEWFLSMEMKIYEKRFMRITESFIVLKGNLLRLLPFVMAQGFWEMGAFPIFCKCSWSWGKTTLTGFQTLSGLTLLYVLLKHGGSHKKSGMHPYKTSKPISKERAQDTLSDAVYFVNAIMKYLEDDMKKS